MSKANDILRRYAEGRRIFQGDKNLAGEDFQGKDLSGSSFSGCDLSGTNFSRATLTDTDFSHCIVRGTNFEGAELTRAKFIGAIAGLQQRWILALPIPIIILIGSAGIFFGITGYIISLSFGSSNQVNQIAGGITLLITITFCAISSALGLVGKQTEGTSGIGSGVFAFAGSFAALVVGLLFAFKGVGLIAYAGVAAFAFPASGAFAFVLAVSVAVVGSFKESEFVALVLSVIFTTLIACSVAIAFTGTFTFTVPIGFAVVVIFGLTIFSSYFAHCAVGGDLRDAWFRDRAVAFYAIFGTKFLGSVLTKADFTDSTLKNTDLRAKSLICACFKDVIQLDLARVDTTLLAQPSVRELLVKLIGNNKDYSKANLHGANLDKANLSKAILKQADLSEASLIGANLSEANLTEVNAIGTDFSRATLTGAIIQSWNIDPTTKLKKVHCEHVFLLEKPNKKGNKDRLPNRTDRSFEPGDFEKLYTQAINVVQKILRGGDDPITLFSYYIALSRLKSDNPELNVLAWDIRGKDLSIKLEGSENTDKDQIDRQFDLAIQDAQLKLQSVEDKNIQKIIDTNQAFNPFFPVNVNINVLNEFTPMPDKSVSNQQSVYANNSFVNLGDISGQVTNAINQLPSSSATDTNQTDIKDLLTQLQNAIETEAEFKDEDKHEALKQVKIIADAAKDPSDTNIKTIVKNARNNLSGMSVHLPEAVKLAEATSKILPLILKVFGL